MLIQLNTLPTLQELQDIYLFNTENLEVLGRGSKTKLWRDNGKGYMNGTFQKKDGRQATVYQHRVVALAIVPGYFEGATVNHIDENKQNNSPENLEWLSQKDNCNHGTRNERQADKISKPIKGTCLTTGKEIYLENAYKGIELGFQQSHISACARGKYTAHKGYKFEFLNAI